MSDPIARDPNRVAVRRGESRPTPPRAAVGPLAGRRPDIRSYPGENRSLVLVVRVKMRAMMGPASFNEHPNDDSEEP